MRKLSLFALTLFALASFSTAEAADWQLDPAHSTVGFSVTHMGISKVNGQFKDYSAVLKAEDATGKLTGLNATVKIASVDTGIAARDAHLRAADFFDEANFRQMSYVVKSVKWEGTTIILSGDLTIKGSTKPVEFKGSFRGPRKINFGQGDQLRSGYTLSAVINRQDFGLSFDKLVDAVSLVGNEVTITLDVEIFKQL